MQNKTKRKKNYYCCVLTTNGSILSALMIVTTSNKMKNDQKNWEMKESDKFWHINIEQKKFRMRERERTISFTYAKKNH